MELTISGFVFPSDFFEFMGGFVIILNNVWPTKSEKQKHPIIGFVSQSLNVMHYCVIN